MRFNRLEVRVQEFVNQLCDVEGFDTPVIYIYDDEQYERAYTFYEKKQGFVSSHAKITVGSRLTEQEVPSVILRKNFVCLSLVIHEVAHRTFLDLNRETINMYESGMLSADILHIIIENNTNKIVDELFKKYVRPWKRMTRLPVFARKRDYKKLHRERRTK